MDTKASKGKWSARLALLFGSLVASAIAAELVLRSLSHIDYRAPPERVPDDPWRAMFHRASSIPGLAYELVPNRDGNANRMRIRTNALGTRDGALNEEREPGTHRIAIVGDSFTFGFYVSGEQAYPAVLERLFEKPPGRSGRRYEVLNFGVGGYSSRDEALVVEHKVLALDPDVLVLAYVLNDPEIDPVQPIHRYYSQTGGGSTSSSDAGWCARSSTARPNATAKATTSKKLSPSFDTQPKIAVRDDRFTAILRLTTGAAEIYDRSDDPGELRNLLSTLDAASAKALGQELKRRLRGQIAAVTRTPVFSPDLRKRLEALTL